VVLIGREGRLSLAPPPDELAVTRDVTPHPVDDGVLGFSLAALVFIGLAAAFGVPLVNGITHLAHRLPSYVASAQHGRGWIGHLVARYHLRSWVQRNSPKLVSYAQSLSKPALTVGKGAISIIIELFTLFVLVLLLLLEGPKMWNWTLGQMTPDHQVKITRVAGDVSQEGHRVHVR
jgi:predicted PurR-regulated permease PerM